VDSFQSRFVKNGTAKKRDADLTKKWTNGHKTFNSSEARALTELLVVETRAQSAYDMKKTRMLRSRNPMSGDL
jgi:hypothetical protein